MDAKQGYMPSEISEICTRLKIRAYNGFFSLTEYSSTLNMDTDCDSERGRRRKQHSSSSGQRRRRQLARKALLRENQLNAEIAHRPQEATAAVARHEMTPVSPQQQQWPRGPGNELHEASLEGSTERLVALLSDGSIDVDQRDRTTGYTPLMIASFNDCTRAARILLNKGANLSKVADGSFSFTALHCSAAHGRLAVSKMLVEAGADLEAVTTGSGFTPLHIAAGFGHSEVMKMLIEAGANPNHSYGTKGSTPLYLAATEGQVDAVKVLLRAKADPLLTTTVGEEGITSTPLDVAAQNGHFEVVRELVQQVGIEGCGGASEGVDALEQAARKQHLDIMAMLANVGVVDTGRALVMAAASSRELSVKSLLQQRKGDGAAYVNQGVDGAPPLLFATGFHGLSPPSPRIVRLLVDAGADTTWAVRDTNIEGEVIFHGTSLDLTERMLRDEKKIKGKDATAEQLHRLEGIRRLLMRVEAVRAISFLWPVDTPSAIATTAVERTCRKVAASTPLRMMLPILRRRARKLRVLLAALSRLVV